MSSLPPPSGRSNDEGHAGGSVTGSDNAIRSTDSDAAEARLSAVSKGYLTDPFLTSFVRRARFVPPRPPLINIGTHVRSEAIDNLVKGWLEAGGTSTKKQIVSLGAGSDTRYWRLATGPLKESIAAYVELDFPENTSSKAQSIFKSFALRSVLGPEAKIEQGGVALSSPTYHLRPLDLREPPSGSLSRMLSECGLSRTLPTLFITECVFVYMDTNASDAIIQWFSENFDVVGGIVYEMFGLTDSFGQVMKDNLKARNVTLPGVETYPTLDSQMSRFTGHGFTTAQALTLKTIRRSHVAPEELTRISKLEFLDEIEELELVLDHYVVAWGVKVAPESSLAALKDTWGLQRYEAPR